MKKEILFLEEQQLEYQQHLERPLVNDLLQIELITPPSIYAAFRVTFLMP